MNQLKGMEQDTIKNLLKKGWSQRRIARQCGYHRKTVKRYAEELSKCTTLLTGFEEKPPDDTVSKCTSVLTGSESLCEPYRDKIKEKVEAGLSSIRIFRELKIEDGFVGGYDSVRRFANKLRASEPTRVWRMECEAGEEAQIDYGSLRILENDRGNLVTVHIYRITLSFSRKSYTEAVLSQNTESFIRSTENAFRSFGGVPKLLCVDNLKAAVKQADWFDPQINPKFASFAKHYNTTVMPTRAYTPQHKGKIENGINYVKTDALKGKRFKSLNQINEHLKNWEKQVADKRIHGTTKQQVEKLFLEQEKDQLQSLPIDLFPCFKESKRSVHRDSYVEVDKSYYFVPEEYIGQKVTVRWDGKMVHVYNQRMKEIVAHVKLEPGKYSEVLGVLGTRKSIRDSVLYYRKEIALLGDQCALWADHVIAQNPNISIRLMQGLLGMKNYSYKELNAGCQKAVLHGQYRLRDIRHWIDNPEEQKNFSFLESHELIRNPQVYSQMTGTDLFNL